MRKICVINQKGGVGKTTTAVNLAAGLAMSKKRVLLIDLDAQSNVASCLPSDDTKKGVLDLFIRGADVNECIYNIGKNLDVISSSEAIVWGEMSLVNKEGKEYILQDKLMNLKNYDYVIVDCPPSMGIMCQNAILYCNEAIIPTSTDILGLEGLRKVTKNIKAFAESFGHQITITKVVPTMYDQRIKLCTQILNEVRNEYYGLVTDVIRINSKLKEAPRKKMSIFRYDPGSTGAKDYRKLVNTIIHEEKRVLKRLEQASMMPREAIAAAD